VVNVGGIVSVGGSGGSSGAASGIQTANPGGNTGPTVEWQGVNGIEVTSPSSNVILIDGAGASGVGGSVSKFSASFSNITSGTFTHSFNTLDVIVQVFNVERQVIHPDTILVDNGDQVSVLFNRPQSGKVVII
jgi:hypothetical protein